MRCYLLLLALSVLVVTVSSHGHGGDGIADGKKPTAPVKSLTVTTQAHFVEIKAGRVGVGGKGDKFVFQSTTNGFPRFRARFFHKDSDTVSSFAFRHGLLRLIEFTDTNEPCYDNETIIKSQRLVGGGAFSSQWTNFNYHPTTENGITIHEWNTTLTIPATTAGIANPGAGAKITLSLFISPQALVVAAANATTRPDALKFGIKISDWPWDSGSPTSKLGIVSIIQAKQGSNFKKHNQSDVDGDHSISVGEGGGLFWKPWARNQLGQDKGVDASSLADTDSTDNTDMNAAGSEDDDKESGDATKRVVFCFADTTHPSVLDWDPSINVDESALDVSSAGRAVVSLTVVLMTLLGMLVALL